MIPRQFELRRKSDFFAQKNAIKVVLASFNKQAAIAKEGATAGHLLLRHLCFHPSPSHSLEAEQKAKDIASETAELTKRKVGYGSFNEYLCTHAKEV